MPQNPTMSTDDAAWWGRRALASGQHGRWSIGPLDLWLLHGEQEWQMVLERPRDPADATLAIDVPCADAFPADANDLLRFAGSPADSVPELRVALADRPMVSRPQNPFYVPARGQVTLYLSSPAWVQLHLGEAMVQEFPVYTPSDTWFGPNTVNGELCYATRTQARLDLADVPMRPHRVITPLTIENKASDALFLERVNLPVPRLPVFADEHHRLWTPAVRMEREEDRDMADMKIDSGPPGVAGGAQRIAEPRQAGGRHLMVRAFTALFQ
ncbi:MULTISPECIES: hypothetical protein [unclassified Thioalkalivibrio]|uniref:hypothetical protein n=1 Tax=unclassified Thioalkalivibrio TaxID=2621013 RepID=UPI00035E7762|nr:MULTISPECIES: hypothetical protein [unclassified Thioalkalivibrio]